jgi:hypothetical protein
MIHGQSEGHIASPIMSNDRELIMLQARHEFREIIRYSPLGLLAMIIPESRLA